MTTPTIAERPLPTLSTLTLLCALSVLPLSLFLPSLPNIAREFHADYALVSLSLAGYAAVAATLELVMGPLSDRFGRRPVVLTALALFGPCVLVGVGNGLTNPGAHAGALSVRPELAGSASGLAGAMTIGGGAALSSLTGAVLTERNAGYAPLGMMLLSATIALSAALCARWMDARDARR